MWINTVSSGISIGPSVTGIRRRTFFESLLNGPIRMTERPPIQHCHPRASGGPEQRPLPSNLLRPSSLDARFRGHDSIEQLGGCFY